MDTRTRRDNQLVVAGAFFRSLVAQDAAGLDLGLAQGLMEALARAGTAPETIQYSCLFEGSLRAAGRFQFGWTPGQILGSGGDVDAERVYRALVGLCEFRSSEGIEALAEQLDAPAVRSVWLGFDARVPSDRTRTRFALGLIAGAAGRALIEALFDGLGLDPEAARSADIATEVAVEHGPDGIADVRLAWPVAPLTVARHPSIVADLYAAGLGQGAEAARLVRSARTPQHARLVFLYGSQEVGDAQLTALARRLPLVADLRDEVRQANRSLPAGAGLTVRPWGITLAVDSGRPQSDHIGVLLRPVPLEP